jgi:UDP-2,4-diacetamido-2,4,6-trideoxy-beta-L-altropyranose hydrolase
MAETAVRLRAARPGDCDLVWQLNNEAGARAASRSSAAIAHGDHVRWFNARLGDPDSALDIVELDGERAVGVVRLEWRGRAAELSLAIDPAVRGRGVGGAAVRAGAAEAAARWPGAPIEAWVADDNVASIRCFESAGFTIADHQPIDGRWFRLYRHRAEESP